MAYTSAASTASASLQNAVYQLMANDRVPLQRLQEQKSDLEGKTRAYQGLGSKLSSLLTLARSFAAGGSQNPLRQIAVSGGAPDAFTASTDGSAARGSHTVEITSIATRHAIASTTFEADALASPSVPAKSGQTGRARFRVVAGGVAQDYSVDVPAGATTGDMMSAIAAAVSAVSGPVTAGVVAQGNGRSRLALQASVTGREARITSVTDLDGDWMSRLGLAGEETDPESPLASTVQIAADARVRVDGVDVVSAENTVRNLLPGISLELHSTSSPVSLRVAPDADGMVKQLGDFISRYNTAIDEVRSLTQAADESGKNRGLFTSDTSVARLRTSLREAVALPVAGDEGLRDLSAIGVTTDRSGHLTLSDETRLRDAIDADAGAVVALWSGTAGVAGRLAKLIEGYSPTGASYTRQIQSWNSQARLLTERIARENSRLSRREQALTDQLAQMQSTVASLTSQQTYLSSLLASGEQIYG